jgi:hypothetical protein
MAIITVIAKLQSLKEQLSPNASINTPSDPDFKEVSQRWSDCNGPTHPWSNHQRRDGR